MAQQNIQSIYWSPDQEMLVGTLKDNFYMLAYFPEKVKQFFKDYKSWNGDEKYEGDEVGYEDAFEIADKFEEISNNKRSKIMNGIRFIHDIFIYIYSKIIVY